jgi:hypothetical protein
MRITPWLALLLLLLLGAGLGATPARADHFQDHVQVGVHAPPRVYADVQLLPIEEFEKTRPPVRMRVGGHTHRLFWNNSLAGVLSTSQALRMMRSYGQRPTAVFADRPLTGIESRRFRVAAELYDDADVMVVAAGHPACRGITRAQARAIVAGRITRWSEIAPGAASDTISVRHRGTGAQADLRFGARYVRRPNGRYTTSYPAGSRGSTDGGISAAAGDHSIAAVTAWSRFRPQPGVCAVPLDGVPATDATVSDHAYPEGFRVSYVVPRRRIRYGVNRRADRLVQEFMRSAAAKAYLARRGLLVVGGGPPVMGSPGQPDAAAPGVDHAGRPIAATPVTDGEQQLIGQVLDSPSGAEGWNRFVLEPNGALRRLSFDASGSCTAEAGGGWTVKGAWRYAEHGGGVIARLGWFIGDPADERVIDLPDAAPQTAYLDGTPYLRNQGATTVCEPVSSPPA